MIAALLRSLALSLGATLCIELPVCFALGLRTRAELAVCALANVITNPPAVFLAFVLRMYVPGIPVIVQEIPIEVCVFAAEWLICRAFTRHPHPALLSLTANAVSWGLGWGIYIMLI